MTQLTLALSIAILLALFVALGWAMHWLWSRPQRREEPLRAQNKALIAKLHAAELARDAIQRDYDVLRVAQASAEPSDTALLAERLAALEQEAMSAATARDAARVEAERWRTAYEAVIREDRDDP